MVLACSPPPTAPLSHQTETVPTAWWLSNAVSQSRHAKRMMGKKIVGSLCGETHHGRSVTKRDQCRQITTPGLTSRRKEKKSPLDRRAASTELCCRRASDYKEPPCRLSETRCGPSPAVEDDDYRRAEIRRATSPSRLLRAEGMGVISRHQCRWTDPSKRCSGATAESAIRSHHRPLEKKKTARWVGGGSRGASAAAPIIFKQMVGPTHVGTRIRATADANDCSD